MTERKIAYPTPPETQAILSELARVKALFQARAIAAVMGVPAPEILAEVERPNIGEPA